jgi:PEP-CTERM motif
MNDAKRQCQQNMETGVMGGPTVECQEVHQVPEPATAWLIAIALLIAAAARKIGQRARCQSS